MASSCVALLLLVAAGHISPLITTPLHEIASRHVEASYPELLLSEKSETVSGLTVARQLFPFTFDDLRLSHSEAEGRVHVNADSLIKPTLDVPQQPAMIGFLETERARLLKPLTDRLQEPVIRVLPQIDRYILLRPSKGELYQAKRADLLKPPANIAQDSAAGVPVKPADDQHRSDAEDVPKTEREGLLQPDTETLDRVMMACLRVIRYFSGHVTQMNLDAVIGTRIAEAQFRLVMEALEGDKYSTGKMSVEEARADIHTIMKEAARLSSEGQVFIMKADPTYYSQLGALLDAGFWEVPLTTRHLNTSALTLPHNPLPVLSGEEQLVENQSDQCVAEELNGERGRTLGRRETAGAREGRQQNVHGDGQCAVSQECWERMTAPGYSSYSLTHQVFYLIIGIQAGCGHQLERLAGAGGVAHLLSQLCAAVLFEAVTISEADFPTNRRDLFMEQGALCGILGYRDFFRKDWLARVLSWQRDSGCFGDAQVFAGHHSKPPTTHIRVRREERPMAGHCLAHRSAVALGYLSLFVRFLTTDILL
ncbi:UPF0764 protein C16orf89 homolog isoform X1 [Homarus americanus]|uniref:UPF0764 protein C16orf89 homolog isoform X1 n=1 Tax=Homarus americanus TaxID=6706 RepID=UPI001C4429F3|nr:UPF0764 protein C16orf89 homolog isoform X1 [Homarus americanus]